MAKKGSSGAAAMLDDNGRKPLKLDYKQTFRVGLAFAIIIMFWNAYDFVVPLLLEHAFGLPDWVRGIVMGLDNLLALFMLPLFGKLSDRSHGKLAKKYGRRTPFIIIGTLASVLLMVFVPISTLNEQKKSMAEEQRIQALLNDDTFMTETLTEWYDNAAAHKDGAQNYCDINYLKNNNISRDGFISIRFDKNLTSKKAVLNFIGEETFYYKDVPITDMKAVAPGTEKTFEEIKLGNENYKKFVASGINNYTSDQIFKNVTSSTGTGKTSLAVYMVILLLVLIAMATFRSPAVALMPDVTPKPLRSQANAVINLMGGVGGAVSFLIYTIVLFGTRLENYIIIFASVAGGMLLTLAGFVALVNERKMVKRCEDICEEYGITDEDETLAETASETPANAIADADSPMAAEDTVNAETLDTVENIEVPLIADEEGILDLDSKPSAEVLEIARTKAKKLRSPKEWWMDKTSLEKSKFVSFMLILASIFMWFMGYNAISSNLSIYITKELNLSAGIASIINGVSMAVSAIAFIPVGYLAAKVGRKKTIIIGYVLAIVSFILVALFVKPNSNAAIPAALFALFYLIAGFGLIITNVNTFPMVVELADAKDVGQYTGYYYIATMSAQAITPALAGLVMEHIANKGLFWYGAAFVIIAIVLMAFVKHGDSRPIGKGKKLTKEEKKEIRLASLDSGD